MAKDTLIRTPSRQFCEDAIRRILMAEVTQKGENRQFKSAKDFMGYFESLYPSTPALVKQVQRAVRAMDMPKNEKGYFIIDKTKLQMEQDKELSFIMEKAAAGVEEMGQVELLFLRAQSRYKEYLLQLIEESITLNEYYYTVVDSTNGLLFLTKNQKKLREKLENIANIAKI